VNEQDMLPFEKQLRDMRDGLLAQMTSQREGMLGRADAAAAHFSHPEDSHAQVISAKDIEFAIGEQEGAELNAVNAALQRIASGSYGLCVDCGQAIAVARLQVSPEAARCIRCQEAAELELAAF
jgi:DnaK suppressor protein